MRWPACGSRSPRPSRCSGWTIYVQTVEWPRLSVRPESARHGIGADRGGLGQRPLLRRRGVQDRIRWTGPVTATVRTRVRSPQTNGVIERFFGTLKYEHLFRGAIADGDALDMEVLLRRKHPHRQQVVANGYR
ncbi:integrase core domain-containing protein [Nocardia sp. NPDC051990]|uniref:integrase core domain-containing protein n=1 Tax=Nocardia sp. NPDC051990 TaxID=3155285 RepID=UPI003446AD82